MGEFFLLVLKWLAEIASNMSGLSKFDRRCPVHLKVDSIGWGRNTTNLVEDNLFEKPTSRPIVNISSNLKVYYVFTTACYFKVSQAIILHPQYYVCSKTKLIVRSGTWIRYHSIPFSWISRQHFYELTTVSGLAINKNIPEQNYEQWVGVKRQGHGADHSTPLPPPSAEFCMDRAKRFQPPPHLPTCLVCDRTLFAKLRIVVAWICIWYSWFRTSW
jgi:hypothetical protein